MGSASINLRERLPHQPRLMTAGVTTRTSYKQPNSGVASGVNSSNRELLIQDGSGGVRVNGRISRPDSRDSGTKQLHHHKRGHSQLYGSHVGAGHRSQLHKRNRRNNATSYVATAAMNKTLEDGTTTTIGATTDIRSSY